MITLIDKILNHLLGHKYYCVTIEMAQYSQINPSEHGRRYMSNYIFRSRQEATQYYYVMTTTKACHSVEIVSFRSRLHYEPLDDGWRSRD